MFKKQTPKLPRRSRNTTDSAFSNEGETHGGLDVSQVHDEIAQLAYRLWEERGRVDGSQEQDWFQAEAEVRERYAIVVNAKTSTAAV